MRSLKTVQADVFYERAYQESFIIDDDGNIIYDSTKKNKLIDQLIDDFQRGFLSKEDFKETIINGRAYVAITGFGYTLYIPSDLYLICSNLNERLNKEKKKN